MCVYCEPYYRWLLREVSKRHGVPKDVARIIEAEVFDDKDKLPLMLAFDEGSGKWVMCLHKEDRGDYWADFYCEFGHECHYND